MRLPGSLPIALAAAVLLRLATPVCRAAPAPASGAGHLPVAATLEPAEVRVGDLARLTVVVEHPAAGSLELPALDQGKAVVVTDRRSETRPQEGGSGRERTTFTLTLTSFVVGEHRVGGGVVGFRESGGGRLEAPLPEAVLRTVSVLHGDPPAREPKGLARWPAPSRLWIGLAVGGLLLTAAVLFTVHRRRPRRQAAATAPPPVPPREAALRALAVLGRERLAEGDPEPFYRGLSAIVRRFLEEQVGLHAPERTTEEFIREAQGCELLTAGQRGLVGDFLERCDLVKFARESPLPEERASALAAAERLVREIGRHPAAGAPPGPERPLGTRKAARS